MNWQRSVRRAGLALVLATACTGALAQGNGQTAAPKPAAQARIAVTAPEGFDSLTGPQKAVVDVYFVGQRVGQATVTYQPGSLHFDNPDQVLSLLPRMTDPAAVRASLAGRSLSSNSALACTQGSDRTRCGRLAPEVAGVIFDEQRFRVDIFVNPGLLQVTQATRIDYVPRPQSGVAMLNTLSAVISGSNRRSNVYNLQNRLLIGESDKRLRADIAYSSGLGAQADQLVAEIDRPGWRFSGGIFWTQGSSLVGRRKIVGVGAATQFDTRLDKDEMRGTPMMVFLGQRSKVDILRDGRIIASRVYEGGNRAIDTSGLPDGAYEVVLRIEEASGAVREERRFFNRNRQIAPIGHPIYYANAGMLVDDTSRAFLSATRTPFAQVGAGWRLNPRFAIDANVTATNKVVVGEMGATWISRAAQLRVGGVVTTNGTRGGFVHLGSNGNSRFNFDFDLRHIAVRDKAAPSQGPPADQNPFADRDIAALPVARRTFSQITGNLSYSLRSGQIGVAATWRRERGEATDYNIGPWIRMDLLNRGPWNLSFRGDYSKTRSGSAGFAGLTLRFQGNRTAIVSDAGYRTNRNNGSPARSGPVASLSASWNRDNPDGTDIELAGGYDQDIDSRRVNAHAGIRTRQVRFDGDIMHSLGGTDSGNTQYSLGLQTTMALRGGKLAFVGKNPNDSMVIINLDGSRKGDRFEVLVNDMPEGAVVGGSRLTLPLTPYRQYDVRIRSLSGDLLQYDGTPRRIGLYPGNITRLDWSVKRMVAMFGRMVFADGRPVAGANIRADGGVGQTDDGGNFQIEAADGGALEAVLADGRTCRMQPPASGQGESYVKLGTMVCSPSLQSQPFTTALRTGERHPGNLK